MAHLRHARAVDEAGNAVPGAQAFLLDARGRLRETLAADGDGGFRLRLDGDLEPGLQILLAHPDFLRVTGPLPPDESTVVSFQMRRKTSARRTQLRGSPATRIAFVERDTRGLVVVYETRTDEQGRAAIGVDPSCTVRLLPFAEAGGALRRLTDSMELVDFPPLETLALDLRYKEVQLLRQSARETTFVAGPDLHLRFFFLPRTFDDAVSFAPLLDAYDGVREIAFQGIHPHVAAVVRAGVTHGIGYVAHRVPGDSIEDIVRKHGPLPDDECLRLHRDLEAAVDALEARGLVHGNIAPRFVFRGPETFMIAPPCPAIPAGWTFRRDHRLHDGPPGRDRFGLGATVYFAATGRDPQFDGGSLRPAGRPFDDLLRSLLQ